MRIPSKTAHFYPFSTKNATKYIFFAFKIFIFQRKALHLQIVTINSVYITATNINKRNRGELMCKKQKLYEQMPSEKRGVLEKSSRGLTSGQIDLATDRSIATHTIQPLT